MLKSGDFHYYTEDQIERKVRVRREEFPAVYEKLYNAHFLILSAIFFVCAFFGAKAIYLIQLFLFSDASTLTLTSHTEADMAVYLLFMMSLGGLAASTLLFIENKFFSKGFKKFNDYQVLRKLIRYPQSKSIISETEEMSAVSNTQRLFQNKIFRLAISVIIFWLIVPPWTIVSIGNYTKTDSYGITVHSFFGDSNKRIPWRQVTGVTIACETITGYTRSYSRYIVPEIYIRTNNDWVKVWGGLGMGTPKIDEVINLLEYVKKNGIKISVVPLDDEQQKIISGLDDISRKQLEMIFSSSTY
jgi:hypothetical protein